jgi:peptide/nickel transport system substrate-binding protein
MTFELNRRKALQLGALGAGVAAAGMKASPARAKQGGHLRIGISGGNTVDTLDGATHTDAFMQCLCSGTVFDCLTEVKADGSLGGELAESWEASADAATWTFKLRDAEFHNGEKVTPEAVIASLRHHSGEKSKSAAKPIVEPIEEMTKLDDKTIRFKLKNGNADFPYLLSDYHLLIYPTNIEEAIEKGIGSGAYKLDSFEPGVRASCTKNENDYRDDRGHFDSVEFIGINDGAARINALVTGEVDIINKIEPKTVKLLKRNKSIFVFEVTGNQHYTFPMDTRSAPFADNNVRMALKHAIDRQQMVDKVLYGHGAVANDHPIGPANQYFADDLQQNSYDPDKAKFFMKKAGIDSLDVSLSVSDAAFPGAVDAGQLYQQQAEAAGITLNLVREPKDGYWSNVWMKKPFCACYWSGRATEDWMFNTAYESGVPWNDAYWENEKFNKLLVAARVELDSDVRGAIYREMQNIVRTDGGTVIPMYANYIDAASTKLKQPEQVSNAWQMDGLRVAERWSFA